MPVDLKVGCQSASCKSLLERPFDLWRQLEITDGPTGRADQVVVMIVGQHLSEFVASVIVVRHDARYRTDLFENRQITVGTGLRQRWFDIQDLGNRHWAVCGMERCDHALTPGGVPMVAGAQHRSNVVVKKVRTHAATLSSDANSGND